METVYVYRDNLSVLRATPGIIFVTGGNNFKVINATAGELKVTLPAGASSAPPVTIPAGKRRNISTKNQGPDTARAYSYQVTTRSGVRAKGNSDPILIIEN
jgi:hypothetical protein